MGYVLYLNLWGAVAKLLEGEGGPDVFNPQDVNSCQTTFHDGLFRIATDMTTLRTGQFKTVTAGDTALVFSPQAGDLARFAVRLFKFMALSPEGSFRLWPLRGAIARGPIEITSLPTGERWTGQAQVHAAGLEKSAQKGFRLFADPPSGAEIASQAPELRLRQTSTRGIEHIEINWMADDPVTGTFFVRKSAAVPLQDQINAAAARLAEARGNYYQQLSASLDDLTDWSLSPHRSESH